MRRATRASATLALLSSAAVAMPFPALAIPLAGPVVRDPSVVVLHESPHTTMLAQRRLLPPVVATFGDVQIRSLTDRTAIAGFHEGSTRSLALLPVGVEHDDAQAPDHRNRVAPVAVMASRGRPAPSTSAVDIAVAEDTPLTSPVTGEIVGVSQYSLYGEVSDWLVEIRPDADPDVIVRVFHLVSPAVEPGQHVVAGETPFAAAARVLPFASQVDRLTVRPLPHVHLQVDAA